MLSSVKLVVLAEVNCYIVQNLLGGLVWRTYWEVMLPSLEELLESDDAWSEGSTGR
jgi:hypothetical protein